MITPFNPDDEYILEDERVLLRPLIASDIDILLPYAINEPDTWKYSAVNPAGEEGMRAYVDGALKARAEGKEYAFIVYDKQTHEYAGCTRFYDIQPQYQSLQLGYTWYGEKFRATGLNRHCKFLLLQFAFEQLGIIRVEFRADANNARSIAAMKALGCKVDGTLRSVMPLEDGTRRNTIVLSILKDEWESGAKEALRGKLS
ncbi:GNAT family N-acetyltransferase [Mucilaginibacter sp. X5P1]|uniref:GNAT family N-acetyltransferase n=1 Tax=Mucilaginibacter sp. X5P1 TaxID=2723088 RepID=UPI001613D116|nr:GNAT family protein [Mucilaginibacter sp. X5P1]MBB6141578.1 RimJ/RimL family protein N-acetyltransferase [Mucilaginibacter sp. X5P1]